MVFLSPSELRVLAEPGKLDRQFAETGVDIAARNNQVVTAIHKIAATPYRRWKVERL